MAIHSTYVQERQKVKFTITHNTKKANTEHSWNRVGFFESGSGGVRANNFHIFRAEFGFIFCSSRNVLRISLEETGKSSVKCISRYPA